jgi:hypothetical protein
VCAGVDPITQREIRLKATAKTEQQAYIELGRLLREASEGRTPESGATVAKLLDEYAAIAPWDLSTRQTNEGFIRRTTALPCASWPLAHDLVTSFMTGAAGEHVHRLGGAPRRPDTPPADPVAAAGLLTAATAIRDSGDLQDALARHLQAAWTGRPSRSPWAQVLDRHRSSCSEELLQAAEPVIRAYRRTGRHPHRTRAPARTGGYCPEHIPALLEPRWYQQHLAPLGCQAVISMRRAGSVLLVQWAAGGSMADAAGFLGIRLTRQQYSPGPSLSRWLRQRGSADFTAALHGLARELDATPGLIDYHHRRQALQGWCLDHGSWRDITDRLPPVPGPVQPTLDDRKRQEASALVWAPHHPGRAPVRTPPDRGRTARTSPQNLDRPPRRHVVPVHPAGFGLTVPVLNTYASVFHPDGVDRAVLVLNALLGLGTALAPVFVAIFVGLGFWWGLPILSAAMLVALLLFSARLQLRAGARAGGTARRAGPGVPARFWVFAAFAVLYGICETMNGNWSQLDLTTRVGASATQASIALAVFWGMVTAGRVLFAAIGRWLPERITYHILPFVLVVTFVLIAVLPRGDAGPGIAIFALAGLGCSALLPLTISFGEKDLAGMSAAAAGGIIAFYQLGYGIAANGVGPLQRAGLSLSAIFGFTAIVAGAMGVLSFAVAPPRSRHPRPLIQDVASPHPAEPSSELHPNPPP